MEYTKEMDWAVKYFCIIKWYTQKTLMKKMKLSEKAKYQWRKRWIIWSNAIAKFLKLWLDLPSIYFESINNAETLSETEKTRHCDK
jgi:hypothetical protein